MGDDSGLRSALAETMEPGAVIAARCCFKCHRVQVFLWNDDLAPMFDKPMELRATGAWYWNRKKEEHEIADANLNECREILKDAERRGESKTLPDIIVAHEEFDEGPWYVIHNKALCFRCHQKFEAKKEDVSLKALEAL